MDLFTLVKPEKPQHPNFCHIIKPGVYESASKVLNDWANGFKDRDGKFVEEFQTTFNSSFWELYLFACFKELNCEFDQSHSSPDFVLTSSPSGEFTAEATTANAPDNYRPEWDKAMMDEPEMDYILRLSTIRLLQSVLQKADKFKKSYSKLAHVQNKPFVICVSPFDQPFFFRQSHLAIVRVLYAYDQILTISGEEGELFIVGESRKYQVQKKPNVELKLGLFIDEYYRERMADVSAIIFSNQATTSKVRALATEGKDSLIFSGLRSINFETGRGVEGFVIKGLDYQETLLNGCHVLFNPFAKYPLDSKIFEGREIAIHNYELQTNSYQVKIPNGFLYQRRCISPILFETEEAMEEYQASMVSTETYEELPLEIWSEDELMYMVGKIESFTENYMGHYRGWTLLVSLDSIDKNWSALAVNTLCYDYPKFREVNEDDNIASMMLGEWLPTREEAYIAIRCKIDEFS
jgi:hypothetical protein